MAKRKQTGRPNKMEVIGYRYACLRTHVLVSRVDRIFLCNCNFFLMLHLEDSLHFIIHNISMYDI